MKKTSKILSVLVMGAAVAFGAVSCNQANNEKAGEAATENCDSLVCKGADLLANLTEILHRKKW